MKKIAVFLFALVLSAGTLLAQDGIKKAKAASRAMSAFKLDPSNLDKLTEALEAIEIASEDGEASQMASTWLTKGQVYNAIANQVVAAKTTGLAIEGVPAVDKPAMSAYAALSKAITLSEAMGKKGRKSKNNALKEMALLQSNLYNMGIYAYEDKKYDVAVSNFESVISAHDMLKAAGMDSFLDEGDAYNNQLYVTGLAALNAENNEVAMTHFTKLYDMNYDKPAMYESLYKLKADEDMDAAYKVLEEGRTKYPDDVSLLFAEINHYLKANKLDELIGKLEQAIAAEPNNVSLYTTLGNVYDNLYQTALEEGDNAKAEENFMNAKKYYGEALQKEAGNFDATYSLGALYYNKAAAMTKDLNALADDYSKEGIKKYDAMKLEVEKQFDKALPYFIECEKMNPNDVNTLIAAREIMARKNKLEEANELKARLEKVQAKGKNETSFFKN